LRRLRFSRKAADSLAVRAALFCALPVVIIAASSRDAEV
jgi:hypothetical protein